MEEFLHILRKSPLFYGVNDDELYTLLKCCAAEQTRYEEGEYIYRMGESLNSIMIMLSGSAMVVQENFWGDIWGVLLLRQDRGAAGQRGDRGTL